MYRLRAEKKIKKPFILSFNYKDKLDKPFSVRVQGLVLRSGIKIRINVRV